MSELIHLQPAVRVLAGPFEPDWTCKVVSISYETGGLTMQVAAAKTSTNVCSPLFGDSVSLTNLT